MPWRNCLLAAAQFNCPQGVCATLSSGEDPDGPLSHSLTPLYIATENNNLEIVKLLIEHGASVNIQNVTGDSVLHLSCNSDISMEIFLEILNSGADFNLQNTFLKTPLHIAAEDMCFDKVECLIKMTNAPINHQDEDGNTALHQLLTGELDLEGVDRLEGLFCSLIDSGFDANIQNEYGESILHYASVQTYSDVILDTMMKYHREVDLDFTLQDSEGNNFLQLYIKEHAVAFGDEEDSFLTKFLRGEISGAGTEVIRTVIEQQNNFGQSFFSIYLRRMYHDTEEVMHMMHLMTCPNSTDRLGMTPLISLFSGPTVVTQKLRAVKLLLKRGADVNLQDLFGRPPIFFCDNVKIMRYLLDKGADLSVRDRCRRTCLMTHIRSGNTRTFQLLINRGADVNARDKFGASALHHAAWFNRCEEMRILLRAGADANVRDHSHRTPYDLAKFWRCHDAVKLLVLHDLKFLEPVEDHEERLWLHRSLSLKYPDYQHISDLQKCLGVPEDKVSYVNRCLNTPGLGTPGVDSEAHWVESSVLQLVRSLAKKVSVLDKRFQCTVFRSGSTFEDTKIGDPDEFDFVFVLEKFSSLFEPTRFFEKLGSGYAQLALNAERKADYKRYVDVNDHLICKRVRHDFLTLVKSAIICEDLWVLDEIHLNALSLKNPLDRPVISFFIYVTGSLYKYLPVSIDIVPAIRKRSWWSEDANILANSFIDEPTISEGCLLLCQMASEWYNHSTLFRVSTLPAEVSLMRSLPSWIKQSYSVAKLMKSSFICPQLEFPHTPDEMEFASRNPTQQVTADDMISSYMLKNCLFFVLSENPEVISKEPDQNDRSVLNLALRIYEYLESQTSNQHFGCFFLPCQNLFAHSFDTLCDPPESADSTENNRTEIKVFCQLIRSIFHEK